MRRGLIIGGLCLLWGVMTWAQTVYNPTRVSFTASPDHSVIGPNGTTPLVDHYDLNAYISNNTGTLAFTQGLGKPSPDGTGVITATLSQTFLGAMANNTVYVAKVSVVSAPVYGSLTSLSAGFSNPFANVGAPRSAANVMLQ